MARAARRLGIRLHTHLSETADYVVFCREKFSRKPVEFVADHDWLGEDVWFAHMVHTTESEIRMMAETRTGTAHCPASNCRLGSGIAPAPELARAGAPVSLGVDGSASNDESNLMQEVRAAFLLQRARYGVGRVSHKDALRWATKGSAACVGRPELGEIAVGKAADLALFKLDELRFSGHGDPLAALVLCGAHRADRLKRSSPGYRGVRLEWLSTRWLPYKGRLFLQESFER